MHIKRFVWYVWYIWRVCVKNTLGIVVSRQVDWEKTVLEMEVKE